MALKVATNVILQLSISKIFACWAKNTTCDVNTTKHVRDITTGKYSYMLVLHILIFWFSLIIYTKITVSRQTIVRDQSFLYTIMRCYLTTEVADSEVMR